MSPLKKSSCNLTGVSLTACGLSRVAGSLVLAAIIHISFVAFAVRKTDNPVDWTSVSAFTVHASPAQTPRTKKRPTEVKQLPTITSSKQLPKSENEQEPVCPYIALSCPESVVAGDEVSSTAEWKGGTPGVEPKYFWSVSAGEIIKGQGLRTIRLSTKGIQEKSVTVTLKLLGFRRDCSKSCDFRVVPAVTPTPTPKPTATPTPKPTATPTPKATATATPTVTPTPTATPLASPSPSPKASASVSPTPSPDVISGVTPDASPPASPQTSPSTTPPTDQGTPSKWIWIIAAVLAALAIVVAALWLAFRGSPPELVKSGGTDLGRDAFQESESSEMDKEAVEEKLSALILGTKVERDDDVHCTVFAPYEAAPGDAFLVQAFAHLTKQAPLLAELAKQADRDAAKRGSESIGAIARGEKLGLYLEMPGLEIDEPSQSLDWLGEIASLEFGVSVPKTFKPRSINCKLSVSRHGVPIGHVKFNFKISTAPQVTENDPGLNAHQNFVRYRLAFISYASADRREVMKRVQMLDLAKIRYFQDLLSLEAGEQWEPAIYRYIDECDVFYLFWSTAAKQSKWVEKEVQRALKRKGDKFDAPPEIMGVPIEGPPPVPPPPYLESIHFDSKFLYFINPRDGAA